jgi:serine/threonine protein kinase
LYKDKKSGELRVIECLPLSDDNKELEREEFFLKKNIKSPYIVKCYGYFLSESNKYFVMEYCEKGTLKDLIDNHKNKNELISETVFFYFLI